jgi:hypothetical protein
MKLEQVDGGIKRVYGEEEAHSGLSDWQAMLAAINSIEPADVQGFMFTILVREGTIEGSPESNVIRGRAGDLENLADMAEATAKETHAELMQHKLQEISDRIMSRSKQ